MGLIDVLNGMQQGPRGPRGPSTSSGGGMSPITMAILGLLAYKAVKSFTGQPGAAPAAPAPHPGTGAGGVHTSAAGGAAAPAPGGAGPGGAAAGGSLGDLLKTGLGGLLAGGAAGNVLSGGLNDLLKQLQQGGQGEVAKSWVGNGPNHAISSGDLAQALGADQINTLSAHTGLSREDLLAGLSQYLPDAVNHLTPDGRLPTEQELSRSL
jgi:uncharacterized protein YidB (DUF937 family)